MNRTVVIPAAGIGSRLGSFTKNYSKAMCTLGKMPVISHIINKFNKNDEIIILLGYKGDLLKQVVQACHPDYNITFINVDKYIGDGSGLGYSLSCAKHLLQKPFIFWSCDTVLEGFSPEWFDRKTDTMVGCSQRADFQFDQYRHIETDSNLEYVKAIHPKEMLNTFYLFNYVGVSYIYNYELFWDAYENNKQQFIESGEVIGLMNILSKKEIEFREVVRWIDCGNKKLFEEAKVEYSAEMEENILEKPDEAIWFIDNKVIKFHIDPKFISDRVARWKHMLCKKQIDNGIKLPELIEDSENVYVYKRADGKIASSVITPLMLDDILNKYLDIEVADISDTEKTEIYKDFYLNKTLSRIDKYCKEYEDLDVDCTINGVQCLPAKSILKKVDWEMISQNGKFTYNYHGDFHLENILVGNNNTYTMLDWRQNFGKTVVGDIYYDIAKMWHSLIVNHNMVRQNLFSVETVSNNNVRIDIHRTFIDTECEKTLVEFIDKHYDLTQSEFLTAVIFLNIAACHVYPYSKFLFYLGKLMINNFYIKYKNTNFFKDER